MTVNEELLAFAADLANELERHEGRERARSSDQKIAFANTVHALLLKVLHSSRNPHKHPILLSLHKPDYSSSNRYRPMPVSYRNLVAAYRSMRNRGLLLQLDKGWYSQGQQRGRKTSFVASKKLQTELQRFTSRVNGLSQIPTETIILKGAVNGQNQEKDYTDTPETNHMRDTLKRINSCFASHELGLSLPTAEITDLVNSMEKDHSKGHLDFSQNRLRRIFAASSFELGGRFYGGWWQHVPKSYRQFITIDGEETCEYDFEQMNPHIAYLHLDKDLGKEDAYSRVFGEEHRDVAKVAFNAMLNARSQLSHQPRNLDLKDRPFSWPELRDKVLEAHRPIKELFFQGLGLRFQFVDSQIAEQVMLSFLPDDAPCLPIHDSFIMHHRYGEGSGRLEETMRQVFRSIMGSDIGVRRELVQPVMHDRSLNPEMTAA